MHLSADIAFTLREKAHTSYEANLNQNWSVVKCSSLQFIGGRKEKFLKIFKEFRSALSQDLKSTTFHNCAFMRSSQCSVVSFGFVFGVRRNSLQSESV